MPISINIGEFYTFPTPYAITIYSFKKPRFKPQIFMQFPTFINVIKEMQPT